MTPREDDAIRVVAYDADWPLRFQTLAARMRSLLGARVARVEHVGSTAVPGLAAKPILDIDVVVRAAADLKPSIRELEKAGYRYDGTSGWLDVKRCGGLRTASPIISICSWKDRGSFSATSPSATPCERIRCCVRNMRH